MAIKIDKTALAQKINTLEELDAETKSQLLELLHERKRYGLIWEEKEEDVEERLRNELPVLQEVKERAILSDDPEAPDHILIEGDNLEALTTLTYTHENQIDVIYIDPPYNTGNKDFVYNDRFVDADDEYRHSKWLSFMAKRLRIAKRLLSDKGVIFISIDDNEQAALKLLCDEIFEEKNFLTSFIWQKKTGASDANGIATITEYIIAFCKDISVANEIIRQNTEALDTKRYRFQDEFYNVRGAYYTDSLDRGSVRYSDSLNYPIIAPDGTILYPNDRTDFQQDGWTWKWSKEKVAWGIKNGFIEIVANDKKKSGWSVRYKIYMNTDNEGILVKKSAPFKNLINNVLNADATADIKNIFSSKVFDYAKPLELLSFIVSLHINKSSTILDFFAGSGTTLHAIMQLNADDGGRRKCILVTNNENHICEEVTYERNKRVINGYTTPKGEQVAGLRNNTLRYYRTDFVARNSSATAKRELMRAATDMLCIKNDIYTEQPLFGNRKFRKDVLRYFADGSRAMLVIYTPDAIETVVEQLQTMQPATPVIVYVFSLNDYAMDADFETVADRVELCALPAAILNAYRKVLPRKQQPTKSEEDAL